MSWPPWYASRIRRGFPVGSLLEGLEPVVWDALGRLPKEYFLTSKPKKQWVLRQALNTVGLGWVATNTTPFRITVGGMFDAAANVWLDEEWSDTECNTPDPIPLHPHVMLKGRTLPPCPGAPSGSILLQPSNITRDHRQSIWNHLELFGACVLPQAMDSIAVKYVLDTASSGNTFKPVSFRETMGNGVAGVPPSTYVVLDTSKYPSIAILESSLWNCLRGDGSPYFHATEPTAAPIPNRKSILLRYGHSSENWAHQDNNREEIPVQALLLLSDPNDFAGGDFYVARRQGRSIQRNGVRLESAGDVVLFLAGGPWWHGMLPVLATKDADESPLRVAIGLLQPC